MDTARELWPIVAFVAAFFVLVILVNFVVMWPSMRKGFAPFRTPDTKRPRYAFDAGASARFPGGQRVGWLRASWPLATLTVDANWVSVEGSLADVWIDRANVVEVRPVGGLVSKGMFFESTNGAYDGVMFRPSSSAAWQALRSYGWPVAPGAPAPPPDVAAPPGRSSNDPWSDA